MAGQSEREASTNWKPEPIIRWLLDEGRFLPNEDELVLSLGDKLLAAGAPVWRLRLSMRTLHPLMTAVTSVWERDSETTVQFESPHGLERRSGYVGSPLAQIAESGKRVLEGQITRGHIKNMHAAILVSDTRDWTGLNNRLAPERDLGFANGYFEIVAEAVEAHGGEVLLFIGDGVLAVFPTDDWQTDAGAVCHNALASAQQARSPTP